MKKKALIACVVSAALLHSASCSHTARKSSSYAEARLSLNLSSMIKIVRHSSCFSSLFSEPNEDKMCASWNRHERAGPIYDSILEQVYVGGSDGKLHVVSLAKKAVIKEIDLGAKLQSSPILISGILYFGLDDKTVRALDTQTFKTVWQTELDAEIEEVLKPTLGMVYAVSAVSSIYGINTSTGDIVWSKKFPSQASMSLKNKSTPLIMPGKIGNRDISLLVVGHSSGDLSVLDAASGETITEYRVGNSKKVFPDIVTTPIETDAGVVVAGHNTGIFSFSMPFAKKLWHFNQEGVTRLAYAQGVVFAAGPGFIIAIDSRNPSVPKWRHYFEGGGPSELILKHGNIYFGTDRGGLLVFDQKTGKQIDAFGSGFGFSANFVYETDMLLAMTNAGYLNVYRTAEPRRAMRYFDN